MQQAPLRVMASIDALENEGTRCYVTGAPTISRHRNSAVNALKIMQIFLFVLEMFGDLSFMGFNRGLAMPVHLISLEDFFTSLAEYFVLYLTSLYKLSTFFKLYTKDYYNIMFFYDCSHH